VCSKKRDESVHSLNERCHGGSARLFFDLFADRRDVIRRDLLGIEGDGHDRSLRNQLDRLALERDRMQGEVVEAIIGLATWSMLYYDDMRAGGGEQFESTGISGMKETALPFEDDHIG